MTSVTCRIFTSYWKLLNRKLSYRGAICCRTAGLDHLVSSTTMKSSLSFTCFRLAASGASWNSKCATASANYAFLTMRGLMRRTKRSIHSKKRSGLFIDFGIC